VGSTVGARGVLAVCRGGTADKAQSCWLVGVNGWRLLVSLVAAMLSEHVTGACASARVAAPGGRNWREAVEMLCCVAEASCHEMASLACSTAGGWLCNADLGPCISK
jgi:hypothetical protein